MTELSLNEGENIISIFHMSPAVLLYSCLVVGVFTLIVYIINWIVVVPGILVILIVELYRRGYTLCITNQRIIKYVPFPIMRIEDATYDLITTVTLNQTFSSRILGVGNVVINTAGGNIVFEGISQPERVRSAIIKAKQDYLMGVKRVSVVLEPDTEGRIFCPQCGHELKETTRFCPYCGGRLK